MQQQQKTSAFGKPNVVFIYSADRHATDTTYHQPTSQPASQSNSTQLKTGIGLAMGGTML